MGQKKVKSDHYRAGASGYVIVLFFCASGLLARPQTTALAFHQDCHVPLGMEKGHILDEHLSASSSFDFNSVGPHNARIRTDRLGGAWCPKTPINATAREWLEVDLNGEYRITKVETQGRFGGGRGQEYAEGYTLEYWRQDVNKWIKYVNITGDHILEGNRNTYVAKANDLHPSFVASKVRFFPFSRHSRTVCMRVELYGCRALGPTVLRSYSAPRGHEFSPHVFLEDSSYDGALGALVDGEQGRPVEFTQHGIEKAPGWVGWKNEKSPVELQFHFGKLPEEQGAKEEGLKLSYHSITLTVYVKEDFGIQPISELWVFFSKPHRPQQWEKPALKLASPRQAAKDGPQELSFQLDGKVGGPSVMLQLFFRDKWVLLSEVDIRVTDVDRDGNSRPTADVQPAPAEPPAQQAEEEEDATSALETVMADDADDQTSYSSSSSSSSSSGSSQSGGSDASQIYIGLVIGVLAVTVVLLMATIMVMLRRNKQKVFSKSQQREAVAAASDSASCKQHQARYPGILMADMGQAGDAGGLQAGARGLLLQEPGPAQQGIYHEPAAYPRLVLQRTRHYGAGAAANLGSSSCGRLCDYDDPEEALLGMMRGPSGPGLGQPVHGEEQQPLRMATTAQRRLPDKHKFGSTPLFNSFPYNHSAHQQQHQQQQQLPQQQQAGSVSQKPFPVSMSCHEALRKNSYAAPGVLLKRHQQATHHQHQGLPSSQSCFYAATDIFKTSPSSSEHHNPAAGHTSTSSSSSHHHLFDSSTLEMQGPKSEHLSYPAVASSVCGSLNDSRLTCLLSTGDSDHNRSSEVLNQLAEYPRKLLRIVDKLGEGAFGMVHLCEAESSLTDDNTLMRGSEKAPPSRRVLVRSLWKGSQEEKRTNFFLAVDTLARLSACEHLCRVLAICSSEDPLCVITEYSDLGDLATFLKGKDCLIERRNRRLASNNNSSSHYSNLELIKAEENIVEDKEVSVSMLLSLISQLASGLQFLAQMGYVHRDVAARNCLLSRDNSLKLADVALMQAAFADDYVQLAEKDAAGHVVGEEWMPLRWIPWEVYSRRSWSHSSDVWAFGVTVWEVFNLCQCQPFPELSNAQLEGHLEAGGGGGYGHAALLAPPGAGLREGSSSCPPELWALMGTCWEKEPADRPTAKHLLAQIRKLSL